MGLSFLSDNYGVTEHLEALSIDAHFMGKSVAKMLKQDWRQLTFERQPLAIKIKMCHRESR